MSIKFKELNFTYSLKSPFEFRALKDINLEIEVNKITAIIGHTGSGKSTLVQHLNALLIPTSGELEVCDFIVTNDKKKNKHLKNIRKRVGLVFQFPEYQLFEETIAKDIGFGPKNFGVPQEEIDEIVKKVIKQVGLDESYLEKSPLELSGGQKRRVAIAGVLSSDPDIIILDEPTSGLDPKGTKDIMGIFKELNEKYNKTIILICHDMNVVYEYAHNVIAMKDGMVAYSGSTVDLFSNEQLLNHLSLAAPRVVSFANELNKKGFSTNPKLIRNMDDLVDSIVKEMKL